MLLGRPSSLLGFSFWYNNPHLSNTGTVRTQISIADNRISWLSHNRYWCNTPELPKITQKSTLDSDYCVQELFCLLQRGRRVKLSESQTKIQDNQENWKFQCSTAEKTKWPFFSLLMQSESQRPDKKKWYFSNGFCK